MTFDHSAPSNNSFKSHLYAKSFNKFLKLQQLCEAWWFWFSVFCKGWCGRIRVMWIQLQEKTEFSYNFPASLIFSVKFYLNQLTPSSTQPLPCSSSFFLFFPAPFDHNPPPSIAYTKPYESHMQIITPYGTNALPVKNLSL